MSFLEKSQKVGEFINIIVDVAHDVINQSQQSVFWLSVDFRSLIASTAIKHTEAEAVALFLLTEIRKLLNPDQTLIISAFNFNFPQTKVIDVSNTPVQSGAFGALLINNYPEHRTIHPFYSFLVFGHYETELLKQRFTAGTGENSIFEWIVNHHTQLICLGHHYVKSLTSIHHAEHTVKVDYRYVKHFTGEAIVLGKTSNIEADFYVRDVDRCDFSSLTLAGDQAMRKQGLVESRLISDLHRPMLIQTINHYPAHQLIVDNLVKTTREPFIDYFGPIRQRDNVITARLADYLYRQELAEKVSQVSQSLA